MSFWQLTDGSSVDANNTTFDGGGGSFELIPDNTQCIAAIEEAKWSEYQGDNYINLKWKVMRPQQFANRIIFQKLKVFGTSQCKDPRATADKAKRMLAAIDANCGGKLMRLGRDFNDEDLMVCLVGKPLAIKVQIWEIKAENKSGNYISAVAPAKSQSQAQGQNQGNSAQNQPIQQRQAPQQQRAQQQNAHNTQKANGYQPQNSGYNIDDEDDIPFN